jgi:chaperonin cofactor prefoldin
MAEIYMDPDPTTLMYWQQKPEKEEYVKWDPDSERWWCEVCSAGGIQKKWYTGDHGKGGQHVRAVYWMKEAQAKAAVPTPPVVSSSAGVAPPPPGSSQAAPTPPPPGLRADREHPGLPPPPDGGVTQQHVARHAGLAQTGMQEILLETKLTQIGQALEELRHKTDPFIDFGLKLEEISKNVHVITQQLEDSRRQLDEMFKNIERKLDEALLKTTSSESDSAWNEVT